MQVFDVSASSVLTAVVGLLLLLGLVVFGYTTRAGIIGRATTKEAVRQPVFLLTLTVAIAILLINTFLPFFSLGDDVKMLKDCGLATILICGLLIASFASSRGTSSTSSSPLSPRNGRSSSSTTARR